MVGGAPGWSGQPAHRPVGAGCSAAHASAITHRKALEWCAGLISLFTVSLVQSFSLANIQYIPTVYGNTLTFQCYGEVDAACLGTLAIESVWTAMY